MQYKFKAVFTGYQRRNHRHNVVKAIKVYVDRHKNNKTILCNIFNVLKLSAFCLRLNCCKFIKSDEKETSEKEDDKEEKEKVQILLDIV